MFTDQPNLVIDSGVHPSLHPNCHHQIIYANFDLKIIYPPPYERHVWNYDHANTDSIEKSLKLFDWHGVFNGKTIDEKVNVLTDTILNIMSNYVPNETITIDDKDPPWINKIIKGLIQSEKRFYQNFLKRNNSDMLLIKLKDMQNPIRLELEKAKSKYYAKLAKKLSSKKINPKYYWSILKSFINGKKIPCIPPIVHNNNFVTDLKEKSELFNSFFAKQCSLIENNSPLPNRVSPKTEKISNNDPIF